MKDKTGIKDFVKKSYGEIARKGGCGCGCSCGSSPETISGSIGYSAEEMKAVPPDANLGLGCGNPVALASLKEGEIVLDLGSGAGFDAFLAAARVGADGRVIGVDMTPEMIARARANAAKGAYKNVEFRQGEIEKLPVDDNSVDVIISNCVINLSTDKQAVFNEALRVLRPGGRLMVSDIVLLKELPGSVSQSLHAYAGCLAGASLKEEYLGYIRAAGFGKVEIVSESLYPLEAMANDATAKALVCGVTVTPEDIAAVEGSAASIKVSAWKK